jgi:hypothetical protein
MTDQTRSQTTPASPTTPSAFAAIGRLAHGDRWPEIRDHRIAAINAEAEAEQAEMERVAKAAISEARHQAITRWVFTIAGVVILLAAAAAAVLAVIALWKAVL